MRSRAIPIKSDMPLPVFWERVSSFFLLDGSIVIVIGAAFSFGVRDSSLTMSDSGCVWFSFLGLICADGVSASLPVKKSLAASFSGCLAIPLSPVAQ